MESSIKIAVGLALFLVVVITVIVWELVTRMTRSARVQDREDVPVERQVAKLARRSALNVKASVELWMEIATTLEVPPTRLRPSDRFDRELRPVEGWEFDDPLEILSEQLRSRAKRDGITCSLASIRTVEECLRVFCPSGKA